MPLRREMRDPVLARSRRNTSVAPSESIRQHVTLRRGCMAWARASFALGGDASQRTGQQRCSGAVSTGHDLVCPMVPAESLGTMASASWSLASSNWRTNAAQGR